MIIIRLDRVINECGPVPGSTPSHGTEKKHADIKEVMLMRNKEMKAALEASE